MKKRVSILGATGSVGQQALDVVRSRGYGVDLLSANRDVAAMEAAAREFKPRTVAMADEAAAGELKVRLSDTDIRVYGGEEGILSEIYETNADTVINRLFR